MATALKYAGYGVDQVGGALMTTYGLAADGVGSALKYAGYGIEEVGGALGLPIPHIFCWTSLETSCMLAA
jgi:hypothetical protein